MDLQVKNKIDNGTVVLKDLNKKVQTFQWRGGPSCCQYAGTAG